LIDVVVEKMGLANILNATTSADALAFGKPHPEVYLNCAKALNSEPTSCICFEDSFNGLIAAKAARMTCVVVPAAYDLKNKKFNAADLTISSLQNFNDLLLEGLGA
jgi:sugar-phosphatase